MIQGLMGEQDEFKQTIALPPEVEFVNIVRLVDNKNVQSILLSVVFSSSPCTYFFISQFLL